METGPAARYTPLPPLALSACEVGERLGAGGMGEVLLARETELGYRSRLRR